MSEPRGPAPQVGEERRLDDEPTRTRSDIVVDRYEVSAHLSATGAKGSIAGEVSTGSYLEAASATFLTLIGATIPTVGIGGLLWLGGASTAVLVPITVMIWATAIILFYLLIRTRNR